MFYQLPAVGADPSTIFPADAASARRIISEAARPVLIYFTKRSGEVRRMLATYTGAASRTPDTVVLFDSERGAYRTVRLDRIHSIRVLQAPRPAPAPQPAPDREAARRRVDALKAELGDFC